MLKLIPMKKQMNLKSILVLMFCALLLHETGQCQNSDQTLVPLKSGMARVYFHRKSSMVGAIVKHAVIDCGDSSNFNLMLVQKASFPLEKCNFAKAANVKQIYVKLDQQDSRLIIGKPLDGDKTVKHPFDITAYPDLNKISGPVKSFLSTDPVFDVHTGALKFNARLVMVVGSNDTYYYDRPAGVMILQDICPSGDQAFGPVFKVEAGKTYMVEFNYMKGSFDITEKK